jgi:glycosyltransferase involved in cell wall biosynthesis
MATPSERVIHIVERLGPGGIETLVLDALSAGSGDDRVFSLQGTAGELTAAWPRLKGIQPQVEGFGKEPGFHPSLIISLARRLRALAPSAVFVHHIGPLLYGGAAARLAGVPRLVHVEHDAWHYDERRHRQIAHAATRFLRPQVVAVSDTVAERVRSVMDGIAVTVIPPGIDTARYAPADRIDARRRLGLDPLATIVGTAGRLVPVKGLDTLVKALGHLPPSVHAVIVGDGPERDRLTMLGSAGGLSRRLHFLGQRDDLAAIYPAFDVFCLPSLAEGLPRSVLEAQACGVPVVASAVGSLAEAVEPETGNLVPPNDPAALAAALLRAIEHPGSPSRIRGFVEARFAFTEVAARYRTLAEAG